MPFDNSTTQKTRRKYHEQNGLASFTDTREEADEQAVKSGTTREDIARKIVASEDELIWAWSRNPESDLTQIEARDRAQSYDYGRYNISQSSLSRKLSDMDETMLHEEVLQLNGWQFLESAGLYDGKLNDNPEYLDAMRKILARFICDQHALDQFDKAGERTPQWAQERFPDMDPNLGRKSKKRLAERAGVDTEQVCRTLHEPHD